MSRSRARSTAQRGHEMRSKALRQMGITPDSLMNKFLHDGTGRLTQQEFAIFWSALDAEAQAPRTFLKRLMTVLMDLLDETVTIGYRAQTLVNTINFIALSFKITPDRSLQEPIQRWQENRADYSQRAIAAEEVMGTAIARFKQDAQTDNLRWLTQIVLQMVALRTLHEFEEVTNIMQHSTMQGRPIVGDEFVCNYQFIYQRCMGSEAELAHVLDNLLMLTRTSRRQRAISTPMANITLLAVMHVIEELVTRRRVPNVNLTRRLIHTLQPYYYWPFPIGPVARRMLGVLKQESLAPGSQAIKQFIQENHVPWMLPDPSVVAADRAPAPGTAAAQEMAQREELTDDGQRPRPLIYFMNPMSVDARFQASVMVLQNHKEGEDLYMEISRRLEVYRANFRHLGAGGATPSGAAGKAGAGGLSPVEETPQGGMDSSSGGASIGTTKQRSMTAGGALESSGRTPSFAGSNSSLRAPPPPPGLTHTGHTTPGSARASNRQPFRELPHFSSDSLTYFSAPLGDCLQRRGPPPRNSVAFATDVRYPMSSQVVAALLLNILEHDLNVDDSVRAAVRKLPKPALDELFDLAVEVLSSAIAQGEFQQAPQARREGLDKVILRLMNLSQVYGTTAGGLAAPGRFDGELPPEWPPAGGFPDLPPLRHIARWVNAAYGTFTRDEIEERGGCPYPLTPAFPVLCNLVDAMAPFAAETPPDQLLVVRLVLAGGDSLLHNFVCAYLKLMDEQPERIDRMELQFFIVPLEPNLLAAFLARHDAWYNRHVYVPFRAEPLTVPTCDRYPLSMTVDDEPSPIGRFLRSSVSDYVREAPESYNVALFKCEAWTPGSRELQRLYRGKGTFQPDAVLPILGRFELGERAAGHAFATQYGSPSIDDAVHNKNFSYDAALLRASFTQVSADGTIVREVSEPDGRYRAIHLANVPCHADSCFPADPSSSWLEMSVVFGDQKPGRTRLANEPQQHVAAVDISCCDAADSFYVLIDGTSFGPFRRVKISRLTLHFQQMVPGEMEPVDVDQPVVFPVRTFVPLSM